MKKIIYEITTNGSIEIKESRLIALLQSLTVVVFVVPFLLYVIINKVTHIGVLSFCGIFILALGFAGKSAFRKSITGSAFLINNESREISYNGKTRCNFGDVKQVTVDQVKDRHDKKHWALFIDANNQTEIFLGIDTDQNKTRTLGKAAAKLLNVDMQTTKNRRVSK